jgi:hypothetical protein
MSKIAMIEEKKKKKNGLTVDNQSDMQQVKEHMEKKKKRWLE